MQYLYDNAHEFASDSFESEVGDVAAGMDGGTLFLEGVNATAEQKEFFEEKYGAIADGAPLLSGDELRERRDASDLPDDLNPEALGEEDYVILADDEWYAVDGRRRRGNVAKAIAEHRDSIDTVDSGPVHEGLTEEIHETNLDLHWGSESNTDQDHRLMASTARLRDENYAEYIREQVEAGEVDPDNAAVVMGAGHYLDRLLAADFDVTGVNHPMAGGGGGEPVKRNAVRNALADSEAGHVLCNDAAEVADRVGPDAAQAHLASVAAESMLDGRLGQVESTWAHEYDDALTEASEGAESDTERVERMQRAAREKIGEITDVEDAVEAGDLDPSFPEERRDLPTVVASEMLPADADAADRGAVRTLVTQGDCDLTARDLASVRELVDHRRDDRAVRPFDGRESVDGLVDEVADRHAERSRTRRAVDAVRSAVGGLFGSSDARHERTSRDTGDASRDAGSPEVAADHPVWPEDAQPWSLSRDLGDGNLELPIRDVAGEEVSPRVAGAVATLTGETERTLEPSEEDIGSAPTRIGPSGEKAAAGCEATPDAAVAPESVETPDREEGGQGVTRK